MFPAAGSHKPARPCARSTPGERKHKQLKHKMRGKRVPIGLFEV
jgi:hypothetical protein